MTSKTFVPGTVIDSPWLNDVNTSTYVTVPSLATIRTDLANTTDLTKGVALVGGASRVVASISALRTLPKTGSPEAFVTGYYVQGDGGGGTYYYDPTDTTTADNGGTVIVAGDGGRWKLVVIGTISIRQFGAKGDSNGTTGNGTDDTAAIQACVTWAGNIGKSVFLPIGIYRITASISFIGSTNKYEFIGESNLQTQIFADFTSGTATAALMLNNVTGTRAYVKFKNFYLNGVSNSKVSGIYCNWTGSFSLIEDLLITHFQNGIQVANDYFMKIKNCYCDSNLNCGIQLGYDITGAGAGCNNNTIEGGLNNANGYCGILVYSCRALGLLQTSAESNKSYNIYLDNVYGAAIVGQYMEYDPALGGSPQAQLYMTNCIGISVQGLSVSSFMNAGNFIIWVGPGCTGITLTGIAIEFPSGGTTSNAVGILIDTSSYVKISGSSIANTAIGVQLQTTARATIESTNFVNNTHPLITQNAATSILTWKETTPALVSASLFGAASIVDLEYTTGTESKVGSYKSFNVSILYSTLSAGGSQVLIQTVLPGQQWRILDIFLVGVTAFAGGSGNRNLQVTDGTNVYSVIPAASIQATNRQARWGSTDVPYSSPYYAMLQNTVAGTNLLAAYSGGTNDYTSGQCSLVVVAQRVA